MAPRGFVQDPSKLDEQHKNQMRLEKGLIHTSGKMILLDKLLPKLKSEGHKVNWFVHPHDVVSRVFHRPALQASPRFMTY